MHPVRRVCCIGRCASGQTESRWAVICAGGSNNNGLLAGVGALLFAAAASVLGGGDKKGGAGTAAKVTCDASATPITPLHCGNALILNTCDLPV